MKPLQYLCLSFHHISLFVVTKHSVLDWAQCPDKSHWNRRFLLVKLFQTVIDPFLEGLDHQWVQCYNSTKVEDWAT
jgi:hypothetical protein